MFGEIMAEHSQLLLFGDLTYKSFEGLRALLFSKENMSMASFFERVSIALRAEIGSLPYNQRQDFVSFTDLQELLYSTPTSPFYHPALEIALSCTYQFGCFIRFAYETTT
jgi:hypothetical protein